VGVCDVWRGGVMEEELFLDGERCSPILGQLKDFEVKRETIFYCRLEREI
jgi:hypothetical protein